MIDVLENINKQINKEFTYNSGYKYSANLHNNDYYKLLISRVAEDKTKDYGIDSVYFLWLEDLSILHFEYAIYANIKLKDDTLAKEHILKSSQYGYMCLEYGSQSCGCFEGKNPFIVQNKATFMMSNLLLVNNIAHFTSVANHLINSLNSKSCIIKKGYKDSTISWFILKLYSISSKEDITLHKLLQPKDTKPYKEVLDNWDTKDINEVSKYIELLCDAHIIQAKFNYEIYQEEINDGDVFGLKYKELFCIGTYALPFEVLFLLQIRKLNNLENPNEFNHPLMNTGITKLYLNLENKPMQYELKEANELIKKLKDNCKNFEKSTKGKDK